jgi:hypothetical protein
MWKIYEAHFMQLSVASCYFLPTRPSLFAVNQSPSTNDSRLNSEIQDASKKKVSK